MEDKKLGRTGEGDTGKKLKKEKDWGETEERETGEKQGRETGDRLGRDTGELTFGVIMKPRSL